MDSGVENMSEMRNMEGAISWKHALRCFVIGMSAWIMILILTAPAVVSVESGTSSGSSGGGGGGTAGENFSNIELKEKYDLFINKDKTTSYCFRNVGNPIICINITGNVIAGEVTTTVEVLKNTSLLVKTPPEALVYKNVNIWVGTSGFPTPANIKEATIRFKVENSWLISNNVQANDVSLLKWENAWNVLETKEVSRDYGFTYYESKTNTFSPFAIVAQVPNAAATPVLGINIGDPKNGTTVFWSQEGYSVKGTISGINTGLRTYVIVHPVTTTKFWVQRFPTINGGSWESVVYLGTKDTGANESYEIYAIITDKTLTEGAELEALPDNVAMARASVFRPAHGAKATVSSQTLLTPGTTSKQGDLNWTLLGGAFLAVLLIGLFLLRTHISKEKVPDSIEKTISKTFRQKDINITSAFGYKGASIIYKVKVENNTPEPMSDIKIYPYVPDVFLLKEKEKSIALIEPKSSQTVTFDIRPTGECGDCNVSGRINYYDMASRKRLDIELESKSLSIVCPMLHGKEISEADWHEAVSNLVKTEESTKEIEMPAESLFTMTSRIIKDMHMYTLKPEITQSQQLFNGVTCFYGEGVKGLKYAAQIEVVGGAKRSKLILKAWAEKEDALTGFYHGILDEIEKRVTVKGYIDDSIVQYNIHYGDKIGTQVKDSIVQHSTIGAGARKCPDCGKEVETNKNFCPECGARL